jgi:hypothetical protein
MKKVIITVRTLLLLGVSLVPMLALAQQDLPPFEEQVLDVPFDSGISLLIAAGVGYGLKKAREKRTA